MAFDGSESSQHAFELGVELATGFKAAILLVSVTSTADFEALPENNFDLITQELRGLCQRCFRKGVSCKYRFDVGETADQMLQAANECGADFIIIGSPEHAKGHKLESGWSNVLLRAHQPVTVVK